MHAIVALSAAQQEQRVKLRTELAFARRECDARSGAQTDLRGPLGGEHWRWRVSGDTQWRNACDNPIRLSALQGDNFAGCVRVPRAECPRQDSNLRSRLRRPVLFTSSTWQNAPFPPAWGAYGESAGYELLDQDAATSFDQRQRRRARIVVESSC